MWTTSAIALAGATILGLFMLSLAVAKRDTFDELRILYDLRVVRRAAHSLGQFGLGALMWFTAYIAVMVPLIQSVRNSPVVLILVPLVTVTFMLARVAVLSILEPAPRRIQTPRDFSSSVAEDRNENATKSDDPLQSVDHEEKQQNNRVHVRTGNE